MVRILHLIGSKGSRHFAHVGGDESAGGASAGFAHRAENAEFLTRALEARTYAFASYRVFLANFFLDFSAEEFRLDSLRRSALGERRGEFRCRKLKH